MRMRIVALAGVILAAAAAARAQNIIPNSEFDTNVSGWIVDAGDAFAWDPLDWQGNPESGSARLTAGPGTAPIGGGVSSPCLPPLFVPFEMFARVRFPSGQAEEGYAGLSVIAYDDAGCTSVFQSWTSPLVFSTGATDTWIPVGIPEIPPVLAVAMRFRFRVANTAAGTGNFFALFDLVVGGPQGTTPVSLQSFTIE